MPYMRNTCSIYLKFGKKKVKIPVNPEEPVIHRPTNHKKYEVLQPGKDSGQSGRDRDSASHRQQDL